MFGLVIAAVVGALGFAAINFGAVKRRDPGTKVMQEIARAIREGADAFMGNEYRVIGITAAFITVILVVTVAWYAGVAFLLGAAMSASAALVGMRIATIANVRVANAARQTGSLGHTLKVAFQGGSVMGLSVGGFALLGLGTVYLVFGRLLGQTDPASIDATVNWIGIDFLPFEMTVTGYALGCSIIV